MKSRKNVVINDVCVMVVIEKQSVGSGVHVAFYGRHYGFLSYFQYEVGAELRTTHYLRRKTKGI